MFFQAIRRVRDWFKRLPLSRKILTVVLMVLLLVLSPGLYIRATLLYGKISCSLAGGKYTMGGIAGNRFCLQTYPDAGKACRSSDECLGACVLYEVSPEQAPTEGVCKTNNDPYECYAVIEYPEFYGCAD